MAKRLHRQLVQRSLAAPLILALSFVLVGCYTILKHPVTSQEGPEYTEHPQEYYRQNCIDCHADYTDYPYGYFYGEYPEHYFEYPRWGYYYAYPWWWDHYWYGGVEDESDRSGESGIKASRRGGGLMPPYSVGAPALNTGAATRGGYRGGGATPPPKGGSGSRSAGTAERDGRIKTRVVVPADSEGESENEDGKKKQTADDQQKAPRRGGTPPR